MSEYQQGSVEQPMSSEEETILVEDRSPFVSRGQGVVLGSLFVGAMMFLMVQNYGSTSTPRFSSSKMELAKSGDYFYSSLSSTDKKSLFDEFKTKFGKSYSDEEEDEKYANFESFLSLIDERNAAEELADGTALHGITRFADMSDSEFRSNFLGYSASGSSGSSMEGKNGETTFAAKSTSRTYRDWVGELTTPVKDQGYCGSCWAFSATEQIESNAIAAGILTTDDALSPEQIVACDTTDDGCDGGLTIYAYYYVYTAGGLELNTSYPYNTKTYYGHSTSCTSTEADFVVTVTDYYYLKSEDAMETYVLTTGPLSVCLDASSWSTYVNGTLSVCGDTVDHCVQIVGVDLDNEYWLVRNSWGTAWGLEGYIQLKTGVNLCDITYIPTYTSVEAV